MRKVIAVMVACMFAILVELYSPVKEPALLLEQDIGVPTKEFEEMTFKRVQTERIFDGKLFAPEDIAMVNATYGFASLTTGEIVAIVFDLDSPSTFSTVLRTGEDLKSCGELSSEPRCGRPLGLKFIPPEESKNLYSRYLKSSNEKGLLLIADAYKGLLIANPWNGGELVTIVSHVNGKPLRFSNAIAISSKTGDVYLSDSSSRFGRNQVVYEVLESSKTGRIIKFSPKTGQAEEILSDIPFPNGLVLINQDRDLIVAITTRYKLFRLNLETKEFSIFVHLPGNPDNLELSKDGTKIFAGMAAKRTELLKFLQRNPLLRKVFAFALPYNVLFLFMKSFTFIAEVNIEDRKITIWEDSSPGNTPYVAGVHHIGNSYYLTSWKNNFLAKITTPSFGV